MIIRDRLGNVLKKDGFTRTGRRNDQRALALALRRNNINDARRLVLPRGIKGIEAYFLVRRQVSQVVEIYTMPIGVRLSEIHCRNFCVRKLALTFIRPPAFAIYGV